MLPAAMAIRSNRSGKRLKDIERLCADRAGRPDQRNARARLALGAIGIAHRDQQSKASARNQPATKVKMSASMRSRNATVPGNQIAAVLHAGIALEHRFGQVTIEANPGDDRAKEESPQPMRSEAEAPEADDAGDRRADHAGAKTLPSTCLGDDRRELVAADLAADHIGEGVGRARCRG